MDHLYALLRCEQAVLYLHWFEVPHQGLGPWDCCAAVIQAWREAKRGGLH